MAAEPPCIDDFCKIPLSQWQRISGSPEDNPAFRARRGEFTYDLRMVGKQPFVDMTRHTTDTFLGSYPKENAGRIYDQLDRRTQGTSL